MSFCGICAKVNVNSVLHERVFVEYVAKTDGNALCGKTLLYSNSVLHEQVFVGYVAKINDNALCDKNQW